MKGCRGHRVVKWSSYPIFGLPTLQLNPVATVVERGNLQRLSWRITIGGSQLGHGLPFRCAYPLHCWQNPMVCDFRMSPLPRLVKFCWVVRSFSEFWDAQFVMAAIFISWRIWYISQNEASLRLELNVYLSLYLMIIIWNNCALLFIITNLAPERFSGLPLTNNWTCRLNILLRAVYHQLNLNCFDKLQWKLQSR